jgi:hypothetical protein
MFCDSRFINVILINSVCIENSAFQAVSETKNTLVGHSVNCVCLCGGGGGEVEYMHIWDVT